MRIIAPIQPVDYLVIGHVTHDLTPSGPVLGGTATYAALTARALGLRVGLVTACTPETDLSLLDGVQISRHFSDVNTTFENITTPQGRKQYIHHVAPLVDYSQVPETWRNAPIVHLGPVAGEVEPNLARSFPGSFVGLTPQGWMRQWDEKGRVSFGDWYESAYVLQNADAVVMSIEDVAGNERVVDDMATHARVLAVTEGKAGARLYWNGDVRRFPPPTVDEVDSVGAGDIFAATFFARLRITRDPWEAVRCANQLASASVTRSGMVSIPTADEVQNCIVEVIQE